MILGEHSYIIGEVYNPFDIKITVGKFTSIAAGLQIIASDHPMKQVSTFPFFELHGLDYEHCQNGDEIIIGNDVWIGMGVSIKHGVKIGDGAVIGAKTVVTRDVQDYAVVCGNPFVTKKFRFSPPICGKIKSMAWWNWDFELIKARIQDFKYPEIFIDKYYEESCK